MRQKRRDRKRVGIRPRLFRAGVALIGVWWLGTGCASGGTDIELPKTPMGMGQIRIDAVTNDPEEETYLRSSSRESTLLFNLISEAERSTSFWDIFRPQNERDRIESTYRQTAIAMVNADETGKTMVSQEGAIDPAWFPSGEAFAFSMLQGQTAMLGRARLGSRTAAVQFISPTPCTQYDRQPSISPDGTRVLFATYAAGDPAAIAIMDIETTTSKCRILFPGREPQWGPTGSRFAFTRVVSGHDQVFIFDEGENQLTQITFGDFDNSEPTWSPDGTRLAFTTDRNGNPDIYVISADGTGLIQVTQGPTTDRSPAWSPDGNIYFVSNAAGTVDIWRAHIQRPAAANQDSETRARLPE